MFRSYAFIFLLTIGFIFHGCAAFRTSDGSSKEDVKYNKMSKSEMHAELKRLEGENAALQKQIIANEKMSRQLQDENQKKVALVSEQNRALNQKIAKLTSDNQRILQENQAFKQKMPEIQAQMKTTVSPSHKVDKNAAKLKVKVLYGDGNPASAGKMAQRLKSMGYTIQLTDRAPRSDFDSTIIYFAPKSKYEAKRLRANLGRHLILKPLSWPSSFDLIVVTGSKK